MARDYKRRAAPAKKQQKKPVPGWVWFLGGLLVGLFFSGLAWLKLMPAGNQVTVIEQAPAKSQPVKECEPVKEPEPESEPESDIKPRFDFYTILPEMEVVVPDPEPELKPQSQPVVQEAEESTLQSITQPVATASATPVDAYMLQMGSFRKYSDADRLKASLALVGIQAEIQKVTVNGGEVFHRVRSGPYSRERVNSLRGKLKDNNISSLVIKLK